MMIKLWWDYGDRCSTLQQRRSIDEKQGKEV
jgi:hypothetical protein